MLVPIKPACPRCIGGQMGEDYSDGDSFCLQCGYRKYATDPLPYRRENQGIGYRGSRLVTA